MLFLIASRCVMYITVWFVYSLMLNNVQAKFSLSGLATKLSFRATHAYKLVMGKLFLLVIDNSKIRTFPMHVAPESASTFYAIVKVMFL